MKLTLLLILICFCLLNSCTTIGHSFEMNKVSQLKPGISTGNDARALLGKPSSSSVINTDTLLQWMYVKGTPAGGSSKHLAILFDKYGKMARITQQTQL